MNDVEKTVPLKHPYVGGTKWAFFKWNDIESARHPGYVYLRRLRMIQTPLFSLYLHFIYEADYDRHPHDHPWTFASFVVHGGYTEKVYPIPSLLERTHPFHEAVEAPWEEKKHRLFSLHYMPVKSAHSITKIEPSTITLIWGGRRDHQWGFYTEDGWKPWQQYKEWTDDQQRMMDASVEDLDIEVTDLPCGCFNINGQGHLPRDGKQCGLRSGGGDGE